MFDIDFDEIIPFNQYEDGFYDVLDNKDVVALEDIKQDVIEAMNDYYYNYNSNNQNYTRNYS